MRDRLYAEFQIDRISNDGNYEREPPAGECQDPGKTIGVTQAKRKRLRGAPGAWCEVP